MPLRSGCPTSPTTAPGTPACSSAGRTTWSTSAVTVPRAAAPVRRTQPLRLFSNCEAMSSATPGRASKFAPTTPIGIRRAVTVNPFSSVQLSITRSSGGSSATTASCRAISSIRCGSSRSRSSAPGSSWSAAPARSFAFVSSTQGSVQRSRSAIACSASATRSSDRAPHAAFAAAASDRTSATSSAEAVTVTPPAPSTRRRRVSVAARRAMPRRRRSRPTVSAFPRRSVRSFPVSRRARAGRRARAAR